MRAYDDFALSIDSREYFLLVLLDLSEMAYNYVKCFNLHIVLIIVRRQLS